MAIDPRMYEKYSGRSGDPYKRLGEVLAQSSKASSNRQAAKDKPASMRAVEGHFKAQLWGAATIVVIGAVFVLVRFLRK